MSLKRTGRSGINIASSPKGTRSLTDASGLPGPIQSLTGSAINNNQVDISWAAPLIIGDSAVTGYTVTVSPSAGSVARTGTTASITGLTRNTAYTFTVTAQNSMGSGSAVTSATITTQNFNNATGGTTSVVTNYNGTGQTWRVHTFTSNATFTVVDSVNTFRYLVCGGGAGGPSEFGTQGNGGAVTVSTTWAPAVTGFAATIGGGAGGCCRPGDWQTACSSATGGTTTFSGVASAAGGGVGTGGSNVTNDISGTSTVYGGGAGQGGRGAAGPRGIECGGAGVGGVVIASYRIG